METLIQQSEIEPFTADLVRQGQDFLQAICATARREFGCHLALIGSLRVAEVERMYVQSVSQRLPGFDPEYYDVCAAPCQQVLNEQRTVFHLEDLDAKFPDDSGIQLLRSRSYVGTPLLNEANESIGIFVFEWGRAISREEAERAMRAQEKLAPRIAKEVSYIVQSRELSALVPTHGPAARDDSKVFELIARQAAAIAGVKAAAVAECCGKEETHFRILAVTVNGVSQDHMVNTIKEYDDTPCRDLRTTHEAFVGRDLQESFPDAEFYQKENICAYTGFGFRNAAGETIGHLALFHDRPLTKRILRSDVLKIVVEKARQELGRHVAERQQKLLEEAMTVRRKLESLGLVAGTVAHDFNNKLAAIIGNTELALLLLDETHPASEPLHAAEVSLWQARDIVSELLDFAGNTPNPRLENVQLNDVVQIGIEAFQARLEPQHILEVDLARDLPDVTASSSQLQRVLSNILLNSIEAFGTNPGKILIRTGCEAIPTADKDRCLTQLTEFPDGPCPCLEISDDGPGMDATTLSRVFDPFFSTKASSRGVGLAGVLGIAQRLGACLTFHSQPGFGSTFRMFFPPATPLPRDKRAKPVEDTPRPHAGTVLVVDDEREVLHVISRQLDRMGFRCLEALSGMEAFGLAQNHPEIDAMLVDVRMPDMDGWETLRMLRGVLPDTPALMMSGFNQNAPDDTTNAENLQALSKPFSVETLSARLKTMLSTSIGGQLA